MNYVVRVADGAVVEAGNSPFERRSLDANYVIATGPDNPGDIRHLYGETGSAGTLTIRKRSQAEIDALYVADAELAARPATALMVIKTQLKALLEESPQQIMSRTGALDAAGVRAEIGRIEVLIKYLIPSIKRTLQEDVA